MRRKEMKTRFTVALISAFALLQLMSPIAAGQQVTTDLSMRRALYFTGAKTGSIDTKNDNYVAAGGSMTLTKSQSTSCDASGCVFNLGFFAFKQPAGKATNTYGWIELQSGGVVGNTIHFSDKESVRAVVYPVKLAIGTNKLKVAIDPEGKISETDESNNSFVVTIVFRRQ
jgi:hypothetical protein